MGGKISMKSVLGKGTTVQVLLPFKLTRRANISTEKRSRQLPQAGQGLRILLAEDEPSSSFPTIKLLEKAGHAVTLAEDGQQALELFQTQDFDAILMDVQMPVMNGVEATKRIRSQESKVRSQEGERERTADGGGAVGAKNLSPDGVAPDATQPGTTTTPTVDREPLNREPRIPIIALTAHAMVGDREKFLEAGMDDYLAKPVRMEDLESVLEKFPSV
jgi:CheY-like chemotaxis protein